MSKKHVNELLKFLQLGSRLDLKAVALENLLGLTGTDEGIALILDAPQLLVALISLLSDNNQECIAKQAALCLVNLSANQGGAAKLLRLDCTKMTVAPLQQPPDNIVKTIVPLIIGLNKWLADPCCMILSNLTQPPYLVDETIDLLNDMSSTLNELIRLFTSTTGSATNNNNKTLNPKLHYLGPVLSNLSRSARVRATILDRKQTTNLQRLFAFVDYSESIVRRGGVIGTLRNCCLDLDVHDWLLGDTIDILPVLLLPLAGNEEFDDEDNDKLPIQLQYLDADKQRENDPDLRRMLIEALTQLCTKRAQRELIRNRNAYVILRELHKSETDRQVLLACENLVDILIRTEDEIGKDNLNDIDVPEHLTENFRKIDEDFLTNE